jgi:hypothetical protein
MDPTETAAPPVDELLQVGLTAGRFGVLVVIGAVLVLIVTAFLVTSWARR